MKHSFRQIPVKQLLLLLISFLLPLSAAADDSGTCGNGVTYTFTESTGTLTIQGQGAMNFYKYSYFEAPWLSYRNSIISVIIEEGVTTIYNSAFSGCSSLTSVTIPSSVTSIGGGAFSDCSSLTSVTIPSSVTSIGNSAFYGCSSLASITIPNSVTSIGGNPFSGCSGLTSLSVEQGNLIYDSRDNCNAVIQTETNELIVGCSKSNIPNSVTSIGNSAFYGCSSLTAVTIPNSVISIGYSAFSNCSSLQELKVEDGNSVYDSRANCNAVVETQTNALVIGCKNTRIPSSVTYIRIRAFEGCSGLTSITIPNSVGGISRDAFSSCI